MDDQHRHVGTELATVEGKTYVAIPSEYSLPPQPTEIDVEKVTLTDALKQSISDASPHVRLIRQMVSDKISERYTIGDELKLIRTSPSPEFDEYNRYAEECRQWGRDQKANIGL